jgi:hypothetical protein
VHILRSDEVKSKILAMVFGGAIVMVPTWAQTVCSRPSSAGKHSIRGDLKERMIDCFTFVLFVGLNANIFGT